MKNVAVFAILCMAFLSPFYSAAQIKRCHTFESTQDFKRKNPKAETDVQFEGWLHKRMAAKSLPNGRTLGGSFIIPVVFHIIHNGEAVGTGSNLSAARIQQQLEQLNKDFANQSGSAYAVAADMGIQFTLALVGKDGKALAEPGIERINRAAKGWLPPPFEAAASDSYVDEVIMPATIWDPYQYFNIWVLHLNEKDLIGKATFPASGLPGIIAGETDTHAGVMVHYASVGSVSSPGAFGTSYGLGRTLTHETGHAFGLRHIWGDAACGNDYCNDTPPQKDKTAGCPPTGALNDCSSPVPKMFENYMDYTNDNCVNTFTADQRARMLAVVQNSPRRKELVQSATGTVLEANTIRFNTINQTETEAAAVTTACPRYKDVVVNLEVFEAATGNATVRFTNSGTATIGADFQVIPSSITYTSGDAASKPVTIRILDDGAVEATETIVLHYTIEGSGVTAGTGAQPFTLTLLDNDVVPVINTTAAFPLLKENFGTGGGAFPSGWKWGSFLSPAGINRWVVSTNGGTGFTGQSVHITSNTATNANAYSITSESDVVLVTKPITAKGYAGLNLSFTYTCNGEEYFSNVYDYGTLLYSFDGYNFSVLPNVQDKKHEFLFYSQPTATTFSYPLPEFLNNTTFYLGFEWYNDLSDGTGEGFTIDDVLVTGKAMQVASRTEQSGSETVYASQEVYITNTDGNAVIAKIKNPLRNIGCISAAVIQSGTGTAAVSTTMGSYSRTQKVIQLTPSLPDAGTTYEVTLYFTEAELAAWGFAKDKLKMLKVKDGVPLNTVLTSANAVVVTPTSVEVNTAGGYIAYTGQFTGFSQFMLVAPHFVLPVNLVQFEAKPDAGTIQLSWQTAGEKENKGFAVERSLNGSDFTPIGWVDGHSTSSNTHAYAFTDRQAQPNTKYYYRLKQVDTDGAYQYSVVRQALIREAGITVKAMPNPVYDHLKVWITGPTAPADMQLLDANGREVGRWKSVHAYMQPFTIPFGHLPKGTYSLVVILPHEIRTQKVIKQ